MKSIFTGNESGLDRIIRLVLGVLLGVLVLGGVVQGVWAVVLGIIAVILLFTAATGWCAIYKLFGFSTKKESLAGVLEYRHATSEPMPVRTFFYSRG